MTASARETILRIEHLTKRFPLEGGKVLTACDDVTFPVYRGDILGIVGESGCGKSTLVRTLMQLHPPSEGQIFFKDQEITGLKGEDARNMRRNIQMVFQDASGSFNPRRTIGAMIGETICRLCTPDERDTNRRVAELLAEVGLPAAYADRYPHEMSGGECQRAAIARAMAVHPEILICDEATSALDVSVQAKIIALLLHLQREHGMSLLFISHDLPLVSSIADRVLIMQNGRIVEQGETSRVLREPSEDYTRNLLQAAL